MEQEYYITLGEIKDKFNLKAVVFSEVDREKRLYHKEVNRPGLFLAGYHEYFNPERIQILGLTEHEYLLQLPREKRLETLDCLMREKPVCVINTHGKDVLSDTIDMAKKYGVPLLNTTQDTSYFLAALIAELNVALAERITRHGVLVEVYGEGVLILGDSGIGKSETAIDLVKRGHRLVADDAVEIKKVSDKTLVGTAPEMIRHYVELRGIGVVDIRRLFGMGAVKITEKIDLVIQLEPWVQGKFYERLGMDTEYIDILGIKVPSLTIPVRPGRNLALIVEIAAMNSRLKLMGINTAQELEEKLMNQYGVEDGTDRN